MLALSSEALPNLFPSISHGFLSVHAACSSPQAISMVSFPSTLQSHPVSFPPDGAVPYFYGFLLPRCMLAPSQCSPKLYFHGFLSVHATCSLPSHGALPKLFPTVSCPSKSPQAISRARFPVPKLQLFLSVHATCSLPPNETLRKLAACSRSPQAISYSFLYRSTLHSRSSRSLPTDLGFLSVHNACLRSYFPRFLPTELSPRYFHGFLLFRTVPPSKALPKPFRTVPCPSILTAKQAKREPSIVDAFGKKNR